MGFFVCVSLVPARLPIIRDLAGTIRNQQNRVGRLNLWSLSPFTSSLEKLEPSYKYTNHLLPVVFRSCSVISYKITGCSKIATHSVPALIEPLWQVKLDMQSGAFGNKL